MNLKFLGGCREVGKSAIELTNKKTKIMLDYGINIQPEPPEYPLPSKNINAAIPTHAHLDHSGALPALFKKSKTKLCVNDVTRELIKLLINDSLKIAQLERYPTPYTKHDLNKMLKQTILVEYQRKFNIKNLKIKQYDAGHIPGSSGILINNDSKKIFYTGDINTVNTELLNKCILPEKVDTLIIESTYSYKNHPPKTKERKKLTKTIESIIANGEKALIPCFAVGRAQEVLLMLENYVEKMCLDGMAKSASDIILSYGKYIRNEKKLKQVLDKVRWINNNKQRNQVIKNMPVIVSTAGMLHGGPVIYYLEKMKNWEDLHVLFTGFLVEDSPGRYLLQTGRLRKKGERFKVSGRKDQFDFSAHAGRDGLLSVVEKTNPEQVICVHGDKCKEFANQIEKECGIPASAPKNGDQIKC